MTVLAFLQNQWFKDPERVKRIYAQHPQMRNDLIRRYLFMGCLTGKRLEAAFGEDACQNIIWEESSPEVGGHAASKFPANPKHIADAIINYRPEIVFAFGKIAVDGVLSAMPVIASHPMPVRFEFITGPHPAARTDPMPRLREMAQTLRVKFHC